MSQPGIDVTHRYRKLLEFDDDHRMLQYQGAWTTIAEIRRTVAAIDRRLNEAGLGESAPVGLITRNRPAQVAAIITLIATNRCVVPITSISSDAMVVAEIEKTGVAAVLADDEDWARQAVVDSCRESGVLGVRLGAGGDEPVDLVAGLERVGRAWEPAPGVAVWMPTSGTTGPPKRITYTYDHINGALGRIAGYAPATARSLTGELEPRGGITIAMLALAHIGGLWAVLQAVAEGRSICLLDRFEPHAWADVVAEHGARMAALPPTPLRMVLDADIPPEKIASLRAVNCGTAPLDPALGEEFTAKYGIPVLTAYGATEFPGGLVGWTLEDYRQFHTTKRGAAGRPRPGIRIRIVDPETGAELPRGEEGLVSASSPQATGPTEDGWVRTNDIARMDEDDFIWILGRADDAIIRGGFKIVPQVVEAALRQHPAVVDAAVVGVPDRRLGQVPVAAVTTSEPVDPAALAAFLREHVASYQVPVEIRLVEEMPRTTSMKVAKDGVRAIFADLGDRPG